MVNVAPAILNREAALGGKKKKPSEPLRFGSHSPTLTEAEIEHNGCSDDGKRKAKGGEEIKEKWEISKSVATTAMPIAKKKNAKRMAGLGWKVSIYVSQMLNIRDWQDSQVHMSDRFKYSWTSRSQLGKLRERFIMPSEGAELPSEWRAEIKVHEPMVEKRPVRNVPRCLGSKGTEWRPEHGGEPEKGQEGGRTASNGADQGVEGPPHTKDRSQTSRVPSKVTPCLVAKRH